MTLRICPYEQQVIAALQAGGWPDAGDAALRAHVQTCRSCEELALVASSLRQLQSRAVPARLPSPGVIWWRAQLQRRYRAVEQVTRPLALAERAGVLLTLLCLMGVVIWQWAGFTAWWQRLAGWERLGTQTGAALAAVAANWTVPLLIAVCSVLAGLAAFAVYLIAGRE